ncbi:hypothetical protein ACFQ8X_45095, partial [Embleya sp. NPDC056538]
MDRSGSGAPTPDVLGRVPRRRGPKSQVVSRTPDWGGFDAYLERGLGLDADRLERLRAALLTEGRAVPARDTPEGGAHRRRH